MSAGPYIYEIENKFVVYRYCDHSRQSKYVGTFPDLESAKAAQTWNPVKLAKAARFRSLASLDQLFSI